jgi:hypothetical protein
VAEFENILPSPLTSALSAFADIMSGSKRRAEGATARRADVEFKAPNRMGLLSDGSLRLRPKPT